MPYEFNLTVGVRDYPYSALVSFPLSFLQRAYSDGLLDSITITDSSGNPLYFWVEHLDNNYPTGNILIKLPAGGLDKLIVDFNAESPNPYHDIKQASLVGSDCTTLEDFVRYTSYSPDANLSIVNTTWIRLWARWSRMVYVYIPVYFSSDQLPVTARFRWYRAGRDNTYKWFGVGWKDPVTFTKISVVGRYISKPYGSSTWGDTGSLQSIFGYNIGRKYITTLEVHQDVAIAHHTNGETVDNRSHVIDVGQASIAASQNTLFVYNAADGNGTLQYIYVDWLYAYHESGYASLPETDEGGEAATTTSGDSLFTEVRIWR